ncbi:MAG: hypothetical protein ACYDGN_16870, partial [Acidimicrobiales bacterium]
MSEYQYYEFLAIDRPLDARQQGELRALSTRARITSTRLVNTYHWGDFKGDPRLPKGGAVRRRWPVVKRRSGRSPESSWPVLLFDVLAQDRDWGSANR